MVCFLRSEGGTVKAAKLLEGTDGTRKYVWQSPSGRKAARIFYARLISLMSSRRRP